MAELFGIYPLAICSTQALPPFALHSSQTPFHIFLMFTQHPQVDTGYLGRCCRLGSMPKPTSSFIRYKAVSVDVSSLAILLVFAGGC